MSITGNHEFYVSVHATLPDHGVEAFVKQYGFTAITDLDGQLGKIELDGAETKLPAIPQDGSLVSISDRTKEHRWTYIVDRRTGAIWGTVFFPDMAGDPP